MVRCIGTHLIPRQTRCEQTNTLWGANVASIFLLSSMCSSKFFSAYRSGLKMGRLVCWGPHMTREVGPTCFNELLAPTLNSQISFQAFWEDSERKTTTTKNFILKCTSFWRSKISHPWSAPDMEKHFLLKKKKRKKKRHTYFHFVSRLRNVIQKIFGSTFEKNWLAAPANNCAGVTCLMNEYQWIFYFGVAGDLSQWDNNKCTNINMDTWWEVGWGHSPIWHSTCVVSVSVSVMKTVALHAKGFCTNNRIHVILTKKKKKILYKTLFKLPQLTLR